MKKNLTAVFALLTVLSLISISCAQVKQFTGESTSELTAPSSARQASPEQKSLGTTGEGTESESATKDKTKTDRLIIRQKSISMEVEDVRKTYKKIDQIASKYKGHITNASISSEEFTQDYYPITPETENPPYRFKDSSSSQKSTEEGPLYATIVVKVPSEKISAALKDIKKLGKIETEQESEEEVTEQYIDLNARLKNLQREEQRYLDFFNAAKTVEDMLKIEEQLSRVRGEIESLQAQIDQLEKSARMGTITVYLREPAQVTKPIRDWGFIKAIVQAVENFITVINYMIMAFGALLPFIIIILIVVLIIRLILKRRQHTS
jgi:molecular chaperone GrpE (heat shock protein)